MELNIKKSNFYSILNKVSGVAERHILIQAGEKLSISAEGKSLSIMVISNPEIKKEGKVCVELAKLMNFVKSYSGDDITLKSTKAGWLNVHGDKIKIRLPGVGEASYPYMNFTDLENSITIDYNDLKNAISMTSYAIGQNKARKGLTGLNMAIFSRKVIFTAGNGPTASRYKIEHESDFEKDILIPENAVTEMLKIIEDGSKISFSDSKIQVESESCKFRASLLEAKFPNLDQVIDIQSPDTAKVNKSSLMSYIDMINSVASAEKEPIVKFIFSDNKLSIVSQSLDTGEGDGTIDCEYTGPENSIGINLTYLKKTISAYSQVDDECINFHIANAKSPVGITSESLPNCKSIIMPVMIKW